MKMGQTGCSETLAYEIQTPGNHAEESRQHTGHGESMKARIIRITLFLDEEMYWCTRTRTESVI